MLLNSKKRHLFSIFTSMRFLLSVIFFLFSQVISLQQVQGKQANAYKSSLVNKTFRSKNLYFNSHSRSHGSLDKTFFDDLITTCISHPLKKTGSASCLFFKSQYKSPFVTGSNFDIYVIFRHSGYASVFDFLYPKHVFW